MPKINVKEIVSKKPKFTSFILILGALIALIYYGFGVLNFTDNGFIVKISTPVAPRVPGVVVNVLVKNGQTVKAGDALVQIDPSSYQHAYDSAVAQYEKAKIGIEALEKKIDLTEHNLKAAEANFNILKTQYGARNHKDVKAGVPQLEMTELKNKISAQFAIRHYNMFIKISAQSNVIGSNKDQLAIDKLQVQMEKEAIISLKSLMETAKLNLEYTTVRAMTDGHVENVFLGIGSHVSPASGMFTLVNDGETYVQANFEETDLAGVKPGDKATIFPRTYMGTRHFEGEVVSIPFGVTRQISQPLSGAPIVLTENKWLLLPQRLPVIIKITDVDNEYPLINGMSTYVRLQH